MNAEQIIEMLKEEITDVETREEFQKRAMDALEDGEVIAAYGWDDEEAIDEAYNLIDSGNF